MKLDFLSRLRQFYSSPQLLPLHRGLIRPCMEYASHVWGGSTHTALLNRVESKAFRLNNSSPLTDCLQPLSHRLNVVSLAIFYCYFHANRSSDLANCVPPLLPRPRCTRLALYSSEEVITQATIIPPFINWGFFLFVPFHSTLSFHSLPEKGMED